MAMSSSDGSQEPWQADRKKSKLDNVFGGEDQTRKEDFGYKRPQQSSSSRPTKDATTSKESASQPEAFYAVPSPGVEMFKLEGDQYTPSGTVGAAILFERAERTFSLYFYQSNRSALLKFLISNRFKYVVQENTFGTFVDPQKQRWSIRFASKEISDAFGLHLAFAIYSAGQRSNLFTMELTESKHEEVREGDTVGTRWTGYTGNFGGVPLKLESFKNNLTEKQPQRYSLGSGTVIEAWEIGTLGMKKGSKRIVIAPAAFAIGQEKGLEPVVPRGQDIIFVIEIERIKKGTGKNTSAGKPQMALPELEDDTVSGRSNVLQDFKRVASNSSKRPEVDDNNDWGNSNRSNNNAPPTGYNPNTNNNNNNNNNPYGMLVPMGYSNMAGFPANSPGGIPPGTIPPGTLPPGAIPPGGYAIPGHPTAAYYQPPPAVAPPPVVSPPPVAATTTPAVSTNDHIQLLVDERTYKQQINLKLDSVITKVESVSERVTQSINTAAQRSDTHVSSGISAKALLQVIQRIVLDNEKLHIEIDEKTKLSDKLRNQCNELHIQNQKIIQENARHLEERNRTYNESSNNTRNRAAEMQDMKESLQIELSTATAELAKSKRRYENLKKQALHMHDELNATKEELIREKSMREKEKGDLEAGMVDLENFKQKLREETRKFNEMFQAKNELHTQLNNAKEQIERLTKIIEERTQLHVREKAALEVSHSQDRNNLIEQIDNLSAELRNERISSAKRLQETEETFNTQISQQIEQLRERTRTELQRRVDIEVKSALANAASQAEAAKQQALTEARISFNEEKERALRLLQENFNARLQEEQRNSHEQGKRLGYKEGTEVVEKTALAYQAQMKEEFDTLKREFDKQKQEYEVEISNQKTLNQSLSSGNTSASITTVISKGFSLSELTSIVKGIVNETFTSVREELDPVELYSGEQVFLKMKSILVSKTIGGIPKEEPPQKIIETKVSAPPPQVPTLEHPSHHPEPATTIHSPPPVGQEPESIPTQQQVVHLESEPEKEKITSPRKSENSSLPSQTEDEHYKLIEPQAISEIPIIPEPINQQSSDGGASPLIISPRVEDNILLETSNPLNPTTESEVEIKSETLKIESNSDAFLIDKSNSDEIFPPEKTLPVETDKPLSSDDPLGTKSTDPLTSDSIFSSTDFFSDEISQPKLKTFEKSNDFFGGFEDDDDDFLPKPKKKVTKKTNTGFLDSMSDAKDNDDLFSFDFTKSTGSNPKPNEDEDDSIFPSFSTKQEKPLSDKDTFVESKNNTSTAPSEPSFPEPAKPEPEQQKQLPEENLPSVTSEPTFTEQQKLPEEPLPESQSVTGTTSEEQLSKSPEDAQPKTPEESIFSEPETKSPEESQPKAPEESIFSEQELKSPEESPSSHVEEPQPKSPEESIFSEPEPKSPEEFQPKPEESIFSEPEPKSHEESQLKSPEESIFSEPETKSPEESPSLPEPKSPEESQPKPEESIFSEPEPKSHEESQPKSAEESIFSEPETKSPEESQPKAPEESIFPEPEAKSPAELASEQISSPPIEPAVAEQPSSSNDNIISDQKPDQDHSVNEGSTTTIHTESPLLSELDGSNTVPKEPQGELSEIVSPSLPPAVNSPYIPSETTDSPQTVAVVPPEDDWDDDEEDPILSTPNKTTSPVVPTADDPLPPPPSFTTENPLIPIHTPNPDFMSSMMEQQPQKPTSFSLFENDEKPKPKPKKTQTFEDEDEEDDFLSFSKDPLLSTPKKTSKDNDEEDLFG